MNAHEPGPEWKRYFAEAMGIMRQCYPTYRFTDEEWRSLLRAWSMKLASYPVKVVGEAAWRVPQSFPDKFPTLGQFEALVAGVSKSFSREGRPLPRLPATLGGNEARILEASNPFERLARMWEAEIQIKKLDPDRPPPDEVHQRWMKEFWQVWEKNQPGSLDAKGAA